MFLVGDTNTTNIERCRRDGHGGRIGLRHQITGPHHVHPNVIATGPVHRRAIHTRGEGRTTDWTSIGTCGNETVPM